MGERHREIRGRRGFFGSLWRLLFWGWQALMVVSFISYTADVAPLIEESTSEWEKVGAGLGIAISWGLILFFWVGGSIILGLFVLLTRPSGTVILLEPSKPDSSAGEPPPSNIRGQYADPLVARFKYWPRTLVVATIAGLGLTIIYINIESDPSPYSETPLAENVKEPKGAHNQGEQEGSALRRVGSPVITAIEQIEDVPAPSVQQSELIPVPSDPIAKYFVLDAKKQSDGMIEVITRREVPSGTSYAKRLVDCANGAALYLGEGDTFEEMETSKPQTEFWELCCGSISAYVAVYACDRAGSAVPGQIIDYDSTLPRPDRAVGTSAGGRTGSSGQQKESAWHMQETVSSLDDSKNVAIWTSSLESIKDMLGQRVIPRLVLRCSENKTNIYVDWNIYLGIDQSEITYRIDKLPAETQSWRLSTDFEAIGLWSGSSAIPFINRLFDRKNLLVRITPYGEAPVTVVFNIEGLKDVAAPLMDACHWRSQALSRPKAAAGGRPSPTRDAFGALLRSVEQIDRQVEGDTVQSGRGRGQTAAGQAQRALGEAALSFSETDGLLRQIYRCWILPVGVEGIGNMVVQLRIQVRPDRAVQSVTIEDQGRLGRDPIFRVVAESARRAVDKCSPLNLPPGKYAVWRDLVLKLYPEDAISG